MRMWWLWLCEDGNQSKGENLLFCYRWHSLTSTWNWEGKISPLRGDTGLAKDSKHLHSGPWTGRCSICLSVCACVHACVCVQMSRSISMCISTYVCMYVYIFVYLCVSVCVCVYKTVCICMCTHVLCVYACVHLSMSEYGMNYLHIYLCMYDCRLAWLFECIFASVCLCVSCMCVCVCRVCVCQWEDVNIFTLSPLTGISAERSKCLLCGPRCFASLSPTPLPVRAHRHL